MNDQNRVPLLMAVAGLVVVTIGVFLPMWDEGSVFFGGIKGNSLIQSGSGWITLAAIAWSALDLARATQGRPLSPWSLMLGGIVVIGFVVYTAQSDELMTLCPINATTTSDVGCQRADPGLGIYAAGLGGGLLALAGLMLLGGKDKQASASGEDADRRVE